MWLAPQPLAQAAMQWVLKLPVMRRCMPQTLATWGPMHDSPNRPTDARLEMAATSLQARLCADDDGALQRTSGPRVGNLST